MTFKEWPKKFHNNDMSLPRSQHIISMKFLQWFHRRFFTGKPVVTTKCWLFTQAMWHLYQPVNWTTLRTQRLEHPTSKQKVTSSIAIWKLTYLPFSSQFHQFPGLAVSHQQYLLLHKFSSLCTSHRCVEDVWVAGCVILPIYLSLWDYSG